MKRTAADGGGQPPGRASGDPRPSPSASLTALAVMADSGLPSAPSEALARREELKTPRRLDTHGLI